MDGSYQQNHLEYNYDHDPSVVNQQMAVEMAAAAQMHQPNQHQQQHMASEHLHPELISHHHQHQMFNSHGHEHNMEVDYAQHHHHQQQHLQHQVFQHHEPSPNFYVNGGGIHHHQPSVQPVDKNVLLIVHNFLKKHKLEGAAELLKREAHISEEEMRGNIPDSEVQSVLSSYVSDENPDEYTDAYIQLKNFIETSLDIYKYEVGQILWPVFVHMYLELVYNEHVMQARAFFARFSIMQDTFHESDILALGSIITREHLSAENIFRPLSNCLLSSSKSSASNLYVVRMSREAQSLLKRFLQEKRLKLVQNVVQDRLFVEVYDGVPRGKAAINAVSGHFMGEATRQDNKVKVFHGLLREPDLQNVQVDPDLDEGGASIETPGRDGESASASSRKGDGGNGSGSSSQSNAPTSASGDQKSTPSKKKKGKKDWLGLSKKGKNDPNAPPITRMPLPEVRDVDKLEKAKALREASKRVTLGADKLPSICMYTLLNVDNLVCCVKWSDDGSLMAVGFSNALIKVWSLTPMKLKKIKAASDLTEIDREADDVLVRMMDDRTGESVRTMRGHSGPVYSIDFSPDKSTMLSTSEDTTIRLWSLITWSCLVVYKGHLYPVWKAVFSPHGGYYFASAGQDRTARLWATDNHQPLRLFAGHYADVTAVVFHPNSNYVASGSSDRSVRLWDCVSGSCVRLMTGHKGMVDSLLFSNDGRFLVSCGMDSKAIVWDIATGGLLVALTFHTAPVYTMSFSREGSVLATGGQDCCVRLWNFTKLTEDILSEDGAAASPEAKKLTGAHLLIGEYPTKNIPIYGLHFSRRNVLLASGPFQPNRETEPI